MYKSIFYVCVSVVLLPVGVDFVPIVNKWPIDIVYHIFAAIQTIGSQNIFDFVSDSVSL